MAKKYLFFILMISTFSLFSQEKIEGTIIDAKTQKLISYANVKLKGKKYYGTISNEHGKFSLLIPKNISLPYSIIISYIGCKTKEISFYDLSDKKLTIKLEPEPIVAKVVSVKRKKSETTPKFLLSNALRNFSTNILKDSISKIYFSRYYVKNNLHFFFSENSIISTKGNSFSNDTVLCCEVKADSAFIKNNKEYLIYSLGGWDLNFAFGFHSQAYLDYAYRKSKHAFIDTVFLKDGHLIYSVIVSKKIDKQNYKSLKKKIKLDPTWAFQHYETFKYFVDGKILSSILIDKTDNYKVLKMIFIDENMGGNTMKLNMSLASFEKINNKMVLSHLINFVKMADKKNFFNIDKFSELLFIKTDDTTKIAMPHQYSSDFFLNFHNGYPKSIDYIKNTSFGDFSKYNILESDSLKLKVISDLKELNKTTGNSSKYKK